MQLNGIRFSLRTLLVAMAVGPAMMYWFALPTLTAWRYAAALETKDYAAADRLCTDTSKAFPGEAKDWALFRAQARTEALTWNDLWSGQRRMRVAFEAQAGTFVMLFAPFPAVATRKGIEVHPEEQGLPFEPLKE